MKCFVLPPVAEAALSPEMCRAVYAFAAAELECDGACAFAGDPDAVRAVLAGLANAYRKRGLALVAREAVVDSDERAVVATLEGYE